ncbi:LTP_2 domain-containing protein [Cephalotus follicularis]|uniref:Non-specific lipid-transfer protein n=1 Tax=Cephalotus follicularis TaxID=3775 RepID=A0A1Q3B991_CEPFO|nr:LTP_2 domain-containing protein [Cephalotus follicularis]
MEKKMMGSSQGVFGVLIAMLVLSANIVDAITCPEAITSLITCHPFLVGFGAPKPPPLCCQGVKSVSDRAQTTQDRRDLCVCFKQAFPKFGIHPDRAKVLPHLCGITTPVPIDTSVDCNR